MSHNLWLIWIIFAFYWYFVSEIEKNWILRDCVGGSYFFALLLNLLWNLDSNKVHMSRFYNLDSWKFKIFEKLNFFDYTRIQSNFNLKIICPVKEFYILSSEKVKFWLSSLDWPVERLPDFNFSNFQIQISREFENIFDSIFVLYESFVMIYQLV